MRIILLLLGVPYAFCMEIVVPAYFDPDGAGLAYWNSMTAAASRGTPVTVIMNPNNGPDTSVNYEYTAAVNQMKNAGATVVGYVFSSYGSRPFADIKADIDKYRFFYKFDGFFIDEMSEDNSATIVNYYLSIYRYVKGLDSKLIVINNPGDRIPETFLTTRVADRFMIFETNQNQYPEPPYSQPAWQERYAPSNWIHCIYNATESEMAVDVPLASRRRAGGVYVTNRKLDNPYDALPSYWNQLLAAVDKVNSAG